MFGETIQSILKLVAFPAIAVIYENARVYVNNIDSKLINVLDSFGYWGEFVLANLSADERRALPAHPISFYVGGQPKLPSLLAGVLDM